MEPITLTVAEACRVTGIGRTTLYALVKEGRLPILHLGRRTLIRRTDLERLIEGV